MSWEWKSLTFNECVFHSIATQSILGTFWSFYFPFSLYSTMLFSLFFLSIKLCLISYSLKLFAFWERIRGKVLVAKIGKGLLYALLTWDYFFIKKFWVWGCSSVGRLLTQHTGSPDLGRQYSIKPGVVIRSSNLSWAILWVQGQPGLYDILPLKKLQQDTVVINGFKDVWLPSWEGCGG